MLRNAGLQARGEKRIVVQDEASHCAPVFLSRVSSIIIRTRRLNVFATVPAPVLITGSNARWCWAIFVFHRFKLTATAEVSKIPYVHTGPWDTSNQVFTMPGGEPVTVGSVSSVMMARRQLWRATCA